MDLTISTSSSGKKKSAIIKVDGVPIAIAELASGHVTLKVYSDFEDKRPTHVISIGNGVAAEKGLLAEEAKQTDADKFTEDVEQEPYLEEDVPPEAFGLKEE